ncbi:hypothetical protein LCGC14_0016430 [marine sediment metagenome]|uniref:Uncharacterized protein n=1 Tax=marine sediment metagenome TaxID=412755 RepID=A0A0F9YG42_9ZZZZ
MAAQMPNGQAALHSLWPDARWNISALFTHDQITFHALAALKERFDCRPAVDAIHGSLPVLWNSGRAARKARPIDPALVKKRLEAFNGVGSGVYYTFSNHLLGQEDLTDEACNRLLDAIDNDTGLNGVIVASDLLFDHIRKEHPALKLTASIIKATVENGKGDVDYYRKQAERFDSVMVHSDDGFNLDLLDQLDREKMEILVNENCVRNCTVREKHYALLASEQRTGGKSQPEGCLMPLTELDGKNLSCNMTDEEFKSVYDMGFRRFKLQGGGDMAWQYLYDFSRYLLEPTLVAPVFFKYIVAVQSAYLARDARAKLQAARAARAAKAKQDPPAS